MPATTDIARHAPLHELVGLHSNLEIRVVALLENLARENVQISNEISFRSERNLRPERKVHAAHLDPSRGNAKVPISEKNGGSRPR